MRDDPGDDDHELPACVSCGGPAELLLAEPDVWICWRCAEERGRQSVEPEETGDDVLGWS